MLSLDKSTFTISERPIPKFSAETDTETETVSVRFRFGNSYRNRNCRFDNFIAFCKSNDYRKTQKFGIFDLSTVEMWRKGCFGFGKNYRTETVSVSVSVVH